MARGQLDTPKTNWRIRKASVKEARAGLIPSEETDDRLATLTPAEEKAWEHYFREGKALKYGDDRAGRFAWRQMQMDPDFARLKNYDGARP